MLVEKLGMQRFLVLVLMVDLIVLLQFPRFDHLYVWFFLGMFLGAMTNCMLVASETWINEIVDDANRGRLMGLYNALLAATVAVGPLTIPAVGIQGYAPFLVGAGLLPWPRCPCSGPVPHRLSVHDEPTFNLFSFMWLAPTLVAAVLLFSLKKRPAMHCCRYTARAADERGRSRDHAYRYRCRRGIPVLSHGMAGGQVQPLRVAGFLRPRRPGRRCPAALCHGCRHLALPVAVRMGGAFAGMYTAVLTIIGQRFRGRDLVTANVSLGMLWGIGSSIWPSLTALPWISGTPMVSPWCSLRSACCLSCSLRAGGC